MWNLLGGAMGALGSIYGANQNAAAQNQANVFNYDMGVANLDFQKATQAQNIAEQEKFAQNSIQWRAADAKAAGINPLAALGNPGISFSNTVAPQMSGNWQAGSPGSGFSAAGQSLGRAISAIETPEQRASTALDLQNKSLNNQYIQAKINELNSPGTGPAVPSPTVLPTSPVQVQPDKPTVMDESGGTPGLHPDYERVVTPGGTTVAPPHDIAALGFFHPASIAWWARHGLGPLFDSNMSPPELRGQAFNPLTMTYSPNAGVFSFGGKRNSNAPSTWGVW